MDVFLLLKLAAAAILLAVFVWYITETARRDKGGREHLLDSFLPLLEDPRVEIDPLGYPAIDARLDGEPLVLRLFPDTLVLRTLPTLWLQAAWKRPTGGRLRLTFNPSGMEYFDDDEELGSRFAPPQGWEVPVEICGADSDSLRMYQRLQALVPEEYPSLKRIVLSEDSIRLTMRYARAHRSTYRVLRSAKFEPQTVSDDLAPETVEVLRDLYDAVGGDEEADG
jgi:hypothetical protein